jgi:hypothetical protein
MNINYNIEETIVGYLNNENKMKLINSNILHTDLISIFINELYNENKNNKNNWHMQVCHSIDFGEDDSINMCINCESYHSTYYCKYRRCKWCREYYCEDCLDDMKKCDQCNIYLCIDCFNSDMTECFMCKQNNCGDCNYNVNNEDYCTKCYENYCKDT